MRFRLDKRSPSQEELSRSSFPRRLMQVVSSLHSHEDFGTGAITSITASLFEGIAEYYSRNLSENVIRGNTDSALEHKTLGVRVYGYRKGPDGKFEIDPVESEIVKRIYREYVSGKKLTDIYADLNREGIMNGSGRPCSSHRAVQLKLPIS